MRKRRERPSILATAWWLFKIVFVLALCFLCTSAVLTFRSITAVMPDSKSLDNYAPSSPTRILSYDNVVLAVISASERREYVPFSAMPQDLKNATIAIEDSNFYSHSGMSLRGTVRALWDDVSRRQLSQGGSTITQQLARNLEDSSGHSFTGRQKNVQRKINEAILAVQLERHYAKDEILELYLNQVYYGSQSYGVQAAALTYFGKGVGELSLSQCALLAGLPQRPADYDPYKSMDLAVHRRNVVLSRMQQLGYISQTQEDAARLETPVLKRAASADHRWLAPYFVDYVLRQLNDKFGEEKVRHGGMTVYTTLNYHMQQAAEQTAEETISLAHRSGKNVHQLALVSMDQHTGYIKAMVGGVGDYQHNQFNRSIHPRQPGSSFKLFVYTAALMEGMEPDTRVDDSLKTYSAGRGKSWTPRNYDGVYRGRVTLRDALARSVNTVAIRVADRVGIRKINDLAEKMGVHSDKYCEQSPLSPYLPTAIGASVVAPLEMCAGYCTTADRGVKHLPTAILRIKDRNNGTVFEAPPPVGEQVVPRDVADSMNDMLRSVVEYGTGTRANVFPKVWGKTGTTQDDRDAWFIGFTPELTTAVWVGNDRYTNAMNSVHGGADCGSAWVKFMKVAVPIVQAYHKDQQDDEAVMPVTVQPTDSTEPAVKKVTVRICSQSHLLAGPNCPHVVFRSFVDGKQPTARCALDHSAEMLEEYVCPVSHKLATPYCPSPVLKSFSIDSAPVTYCDVHKPPD